MEANTGFCQAVSGMEEVCRHLSSLVHTVDTIYVGLSCERMEQQTLDCILCIGDAVREIRDAAQRELQEIRKGTGME